VENKDLDNFQFGPKITDPAPIPILYKKAYQKWIPFFAILAKLLGKYLIRKRKQTDTFD